MMNVEYIDLGLKSGLKWSNCFNSGLIFKEEFPLVSSKIAQYIKDHTPTLENFIELKNSCKIREYKKGRYKFLILTGPNKNKLIILSGIYSRDKSCVRYLDYWINDWINENNDLLDNFLKRAINTLSISWIEKQYDPLKKRLANLIFVEK
jgi:hypothetical protein